MAGYNIGGGVFAQILSTVNAADQRRKDNEAKAAEMIQKGFIREDHGITPTEREGISGQLGNVFSGGDEFDASQWTPGGAHPQVAETARQEARVKALAEQRKAEYEHKRRISMLEFGSGRYEEPPGMDIEYTGDPLAAPGAGPAIGTTGGGGRGGGGVGRGGGGGGIRTPRVDRVGQILDISPDARVSTDILTKDIPEIEALRQTALNKAGDEAGYFSKLFGIMADPIGQISDVVFGGDRLDAALTGTLDDPNWLQKYAEDEDAVAAWKKAHGPGLSTAIEDLYGTSFSAIRARAALSGASPEEIKEATDEASIYSDVIGWGKDLLGMSSEKLADDESALTGVKPATPLSAEEMGTRRQEAETFTGEFAGAPWGSTPRQMGQDPPPELGVRYGPKPTSAVQGAMFEPGADLRIDRPRELPGQARKIPAELEDMLAQLGTGADAGDDGTNLEAILRIAADRSSDAPPVDFGPDPGNLLRPTGDEQSAAGLRDERAQWQAANRDRSNEMLDQRQMANQARSNEEKIQRREERMRRSGGMDLNRNERMNEMRILNPPTDPKQDIELANAARLRKIKAAREEGFQGTDARSALKGKEKAAVDTASKDAQKQITIRAETGDWISLGSDARLARVNNNPGNIRWAGQTGAVEGEGGFAKWPTLEEGFQGLVRQIAADVKRGDSIEQFIYEYAPPEDGNETEKYLQFALKEFGIDRNHLISELDITELAEFMALRESSAKFS